MKKIVLCLAVALASISFSQAQNGPKIGLKAGVNYSNIAGDLDDEDIYKNKLGFVGGLWANFGLTSDNFLSIQPELLFSQKGYKYRDDEITVNGVDYEYKGKVNFNYLELPVMFRINAGGLFFEAGPQLSYILSIQDKTEVSIGGSDNEDVDDIDKDDLSELEIGYAAGLGFQSSGGVSLNLRYNGSISDLAKENRNDLTNARHSTFQLTLGFPLSK